jgi:hypothetical protein
MSYKKLDDREPVFRLTTITTRIVYKKRLKNAKCLRKNNLYKCVQRNQVSLRNLVSLSSGYFCSMPNDKDCLSEGIDPILSYKQSL